MRIVGGSRKGAHLIAPEGDVTRPTSDRARESLFNILSGTRYRDHLIDQPVADFFAGSGAVGLEALSRGAAQCSFIERDRIALSALKNNIAKLKLSSAEAPILTGDAQKPPASQTAVSLLFLDPPYRGVDGPECVLKAREAGWLKQDALVILQQHPKTPIIAPDGFTLLDERKYGATRFLFLEQTE